MMTHHLRVAYRPSDIRTALEYNNDNSISLWAEFCHGTPMLRPIETFQGLYSYAHILREPIIEDFSDLSGVKTCYNTIPKLFKNGINHWLG